VLKETKIGATFAIFINELSKVNYHPIGETSPNLVTLVGDSSQPANGLLRSVAMSSEMWNTCFLPKLINGSTPSLEQQKLPRTLTPVFQKWMSCRKNYTCELVDVCLEPEQGDQNGRIFA
jgi:hypothetical protein